MTSIYQLDSSEEIALYAARGELPLFQPFLNTQSFFFFLPILVTYNNHRMTLCLVQASIYSQLFFYNFKGLLLFFVFVIVQITNGSDKETHQSLMLGSCCIMSTYHDKITSAASLQTARTSLQIQFLNTHIICAYTAISVYTQSEKL